MTNRLTIRRETLCEDAVAGLVPGVQSVLDSLATGCSLASIRSPASTPASSAGAMAMIVADVPAVATAADAERAPCTLSVPTGVVMLAAGLLKRGSVPRFVHRAEARVAG